MQKGQGKMSNFRSLQYHRHQNNQRKKNQLIIHNLEQIAVLLLWDYKLCFL